MTFMGHMSTFIKLFTTNVVVSSYKGMLLLMNSICQQLQVLL